MITRITQDAMGVGWTGGSYDTTISDDGRYIAFSTDTDHDPLDQNGKKDVYRYDTQTGQMELVSVDANGEQTDGDSISPELDSTGTKIAYKSDATDIASAPAADTYTYHTFYKDLTSADPAKVVTVHSDTGNGNGFNDFAEMHLTGDGSVVYYTDRSADHHPGNTNANVWHIYGYNTTTDTTFHVTKGQDGTSFNGLNVDASQSDDGRYMVMKTTTSTLDHGPANLFQGVLMDTTTGEVTLVSKTDAGAPSRGATQQISISGDGSTVAMIVTGNDLPGATHSDKALVIWKRETDTYQYLDLSDGYSDEGMSLSDDGRYVVFASTTELPTLRSGYLDKIYVYDTVTTEVRIVSDGGFGYSNSGDSKNPQISGDGSKIVYESTSDTQIALGTDTNRVSDIFVADNPLFVPPGMTITGTGHSETLNGGAGDDTIRGGLGFDVIEGGNGDDNIRGDGGADTINGGEGNDTLLGNAGNDTVNGGDGDDNINGGIGWDNLFGDGGNDTIRGGDGFDTLNGGDGDDLLYGNNGNDILNGDAGNDVLNGGFGTDVLNGGDGDDELLGGNGTDTVNGDAGNDDLKGNAGNDTLNGGIGDDTLNGGIGRDVLNGGDDDDTLYGSNGSDTLNGGAGSDMLYGGNGNDRLDGGAGDDLLDGGSGADTFVFTGGQDAIASFQNNIDTLEIDSAVWGGSTKTVTDVLSYAMYDAGHNAVIFDFGNGTGLGVLGLTDVNDLADDLVII